MAAEQLWALVPAAGKGLRFGAGHPKQYLPLAGRRVIEHSLSLFCGHAAISGTIVVIARGDPFWPEIDPSCRAGVQTVTGGEERMDSVLAGLQHLARQARQDDWVLVHDAARPCLSRALLDRLINTLKTHPIGGLLAIPVRDTLKRAEGTQVKGTVDRHDLWQAQTPQMFRLGPLQAALKAALGAGQVVTDEASAMELAGYAPELVQGSADNLKITQASDLGLADCILRQGHTG